MSATLALDNATSTVTEYQTCIECGAVRDREDMIQCLICGEFMCSLTGATHLCGCPVDTSER